MAQLNSFELLSKEYGDISKKMRKAIERDVKFLLKENKATQIRFKESVFTHLISDNCYSDCRGVKLEKDGNTLTFHIQRNMDGAIDDYTEGLEEMDAASYYEILLALHEKEMKFEK